MGVLFFSQNRKVRAAFVGLRVTPDAITVDADSMAVRVTSDREWTIENDIMYLRVSPEHIWLPAIPEGEEQLHIESDMIWSIT